MCFVIKKSRDGQFYFVINSNNHETVATSEMYYVKQSAIRTIDSLRNNLNKNSQVIDLTDYN